MSALGYMLAIILHEFGHFVVAKKLGYHLSKFSLSPYGFSLSYFDQKLERNDELKIAIAGPLANFLSAFVVMGVWWLCPTFYFFSDMFVRTSFVIALFNLLPAYPLDGGRIFVDLTSTLFEEKTAKRITRIFNLCLAILFLLIFFVCLFINFNPSYLLFSCFLFVGVMDLNFGSKFDKINIFSKKMKQFSKPTIWCVDDEVTIGQILKKMQNSKTNIFCLILDNGKIINISEKMMQNLAKNFPLDTKIEKVLKKYK